MMTEISFLGDTAVDLLILHPRIFRLSKMIVTFILAKRIFPYFYVSLPLDY